ncbi:MAG TPA: trypsin-like peptidase domain-containing protein [Thermoleophilia bacterium]|nr:trypsin-like peptidase domain-containing protein [Thermoleophilia bacterium]
MRMRTAVASIALGIVAAVGSMTLALATGLVPVESVTTTVVEPAQTSTVSMTTTGMTPEEIYDTYAQGVVEVVATFSGTSSMDPYAPSGGSPRALGTGFVVSEDGYILTNAHVVSESGATAESVTVSFKDEESAGTKVTATIVGADDSSDVALLKIDPDEAGALTVIPLGDSDELKVGEPVVAIGNPLGFDFTLTTGVVSALDRELQSPNGSIISNGIQTDAAINSGNSGGPLIDATGHVIGINEQIASESGGNQGLGFAVPINTAIRVMEQLKDGGQVEYAWLGIQGQTLTEDIAAALGIEGEGVLVAEVVDGSPAAEAGLQGGTSETSVQGQPYVVGGDIVTAIDGERVSSMEELAGTIAEKAPGEEVTLTVLRDGATTDVTVTLEVRPQAY